MIIQGHVSLMVIYIFCRTQTATSKQDAHSSTDDSKSQTSDSSQSFDAKHQSYRPSQSEMEDADETSLEFSGLMKLVDSKSERDNDADSAAEQASQNSKSYYEEEASDIEEEDRSIPNDQDKEESDSEDDSKIYLNDRMSDFSDYLDEEESEQDSDNGHDSDVDIQSHHIISHDTYHNNDEEMPYLNVGKSKIIKPGESIPILRDTPHNKKCLSKLPARVQRSCSFLVHAKFFEDVSQDGNGVYDSGGTKGYMYDKDFEWKGKAQSIKDDIKDDGYMVVRRRSIHKANKNFSRTIFWMRSRHAELQYNCVLVQYVFKPGTVNHTVPLLPHGNAGKKTTAKFTSIKPSVSQEARDEMQRLGAGPTKAVQSVISKKGGIANIESIADIPTRSNIIQKNKNSRRKERAADAAKDGLTLKDVQSDAWSALAIWAKGDGKGFVKLMLQAPENVIILAKDEHLDDMVRFLKDQKDRDIISFDPTFDMGEFNVTPVSYRNPLLWSSKKHKTKPVFAGAFMISYRKNKESYKILMEELVKLRPELKKMDWGTDGEGPLCDACCETFTGIGLRCKRHFRINVCRLIHKLGLSRYKQEILEQLMGRGSKYDRKALLNSETHDEFKERLDKLLEYWRTLVSDKGKETGKNFAAYIADKDMMWGHMCAKARKDAGLGNPPSYFYTNQSETINKEIQMWCDNNKDIYSVCKQLKKFSEAQIERAITAYTGRVDGFVVTDEFKPAIVHSDYYDYSKKQRNTILERAQKFSLEDLRELANPIPGDDPDDSFTDSLSVRHSKANIGVFSGTVKEIWRKAANLLKDKDENIVKGPGWRGPLEVYIVVSKHAFTRQVILNKITNQITCPCEGYGAHKVCGHSVAVAEFRKVLSGYLKWHRDNGIKTSMDYASKMGLSKKTLGRKPNEPRRTKTAPVVYSPKKNPLKTLGKLLKSVGSKSKTKQDKPGQSKPKPKRKNPDPFEDHCSAKSAHFNSVCIRKLEKQIRKCAGCGLDLKCLIDSPPFNMVFTSIEGVNVSDKIYRNRKHFHFNPKCAKDALRESSREIHICEKIWHELQPIHKDILHSHKLCQRINANSYDCEKCFL